MGILQQHSTKQTIAITGPLFMRDLGSEVRCPDGTSCDIVYDGFAIEADWASKWYEGFGQSLWYGYPLNKRPAVLLILKKESDRKYLMRINSLAKHHDIDLTIWSIGPSLDKMEKFAGGVATPSSKGKMEATKEQIALNTGDDDPRNPVWPWGGGGAAIVWALRRRSN